MDSDLTQIQPEKTRLMKRPDKAFVEELVLKARKGSKEALVSLCEAVVGNVLFRARYVTYDKMDAEDVAQESLIRLCENIHELRNPKMFDVWLNKIILNEARRRMRKEAAHSTVLDIQDYLDVETETDEEYLPQEYILKEADRKAVMEAIENLPQRQREVIFLHYFDGLNITEASAVMEIPHQNASRYLKLAREKIKNELENRDKGSLHAEYSGFAVLPVGALLKQVLEEEAISFHITNSAEMQQTLQGCANHTWGKTGGNSRDVTTTAKTAYNSLITIIIVVGAAVVVSGFLLLNGPLQPGPEETHATGKVVFSGGDAEYSHLNPKHAALETVSEYGELAILSWEITAKDGGTILYSDEGTEVDWALARMQENGENGEYKLLYLLADTAGNTYTLYGSFVIR